MVAIHVYLENEKAWQIVCITTVGMKQNLRFTVYLCKPLCEDNMLRIFKTYRPLQVARYVKSYFRGRIFIVGIGGFEFDSGRLLPPKSADLKALNVLTEVNREIQTLSVVV